MKSIFDEETYTECIARIDKLTTDTQPQWGKMNAAQMLAHCCEIQDVANGKDLKGTPFLVKLFKNMVRKTVVGEKPYKKNSPTHPQYRMADSQRDFDTEKNRLLTEMDKFYNEDPAVLAQLVHPLFGKMTREEKGWAMYKHLNHHLDQFGV